MNIKYRFLKFSYLISITNIGPRYHSYDSKVKIIKEAWRTECMHRFIRLHQIWLLHMAPNCLLHRCPSWRCPAFLRPSQTPWLLPASACSSPSRTSCCSEWSRGRLADGSRGIFSEKVQRELVSVDIVLVIRKKMQCIPFIKMDEPRKGCHFSALILLCCTS